ncbi:unnamed protein product, partial [Rotaria sordida]
ANIMQQMINASLEKKNKQLLLQKIVQQLEDFKDDLKQHHLHFLLAELQIKHQHQQQQQSKSTLATSPSFPISRITNQTSTSTTTTIPINK